MSAVVALDDRDARYGPLGDHYMRIGDTQFFIPPTSISIHRQMKHQRVSVIRGKNSLPKESGYFDRIITITLFFPDVDSINYELRPILAQSKKSPFLPIQNTYLNDAHKVEAVTIQNVTVQTTPGFPNTLQAIIQCYAFEPATYIYGTSDRSFDEMFNWPLFRWYYERHLNKTTIEDPVMSALYGSVMKDDAKVSQSLTYFEPLTEDLSNEYIFKIVAEDDLEAIREWRKKKNELVKEWINEKNDSSFGDWLDTRISKHGLQVGDEANEENFNKEYNELYKNAMFEYDLHYEGWDLGPMEMQDFSISFENHITSNQLQMHQSPTHQYLGSQDTVMVARFQTNDMDSIASLEDLMRRTSYLTREYHKEVANGFLQIDHQIARLYGVNNVVIDDLTVDTIDGMPGVYDVTLTMMAYNRAEKKMHEVKAMTLDLDWDIPLGDSVPPFIKHISTSFGKIKGGIGVGKNAQEQAVYNAWVMETFRAAELYPDLELPTYTEVQQAGFSIINMNDGLFVDPDFFLNYDAERDFSFILNEELLEEVGPIKLRDATGGTAELTSTGIELDDLAKNQADEMESVINSDPPKISVSEEISTTPDTRNFSPDDMEALLRKSATTYGLDAKIPVAFVQAFDKNMKHFYEVGVNASYGNVQSNKQGIAIQQDENFNYMQGKALTYGGVMRVHRTLGDKTININHPVYKSIEYNVDMGMRYMKYYWEVANQIIENNTNVDRIYHLFDLSPSSEDDQKKVQFIIMALLYLRFDRELDQVLEKNTRLNSAVINILKGMIQQFDEVEAWDYDTLQERYEQLPIQDYKAIIYEGEDHEMLNLLDGITEKNFKSEEDTQVTEASMMTDMLKYDRRGRLVRAFPTFFMTFIDEGQFVGSVKMSDQYFHYRAVSDITYNNSRKQASDTLVCELSNVFGSLDDAEKAQDITYTGLGDLFLSMIMPGAVARETERNRNRDPNFYKSIYLRTGVRVHMRMGYGSNALNLPTITNGTITSLQNNGATMTMIAQNDGIELTNKLNAMLDIDPDDDTSGFLSSKQEPTEIVDELLTDSGGFFANVSQLLSNKEYEHHSLGIMHFGEKGLPQGVDDFFQLLKLGLMPGRSISEINMNVYQTTGELNEEHDKWHKRLLDGFGMGSTDEVNININLFDKTVWDILNITAAIGKDMITAVHPFGLRNTIFLGKPYFPLHYDYNVDLDSESIEGTKVKSFRQMHIYDSYTSIISNQIKATEDNMYTVAVGTYMNEGKINTTAPVYVDTDIWPEKQKTVNIDTTLNAKGVWAVGKIPLIGDYLNKPAKWFFDEGVALQITASGLRDYVKDMYDGYLTVMGDPSVKPYDTFLLQDYYMDMNGPADVKEVVHIMNLEVGYITMIKPDVICYNSDVSTYNLLARAAAVGAYAMVRMHIKNIMATRGYTGNLALLNALWANTTKRMGQMTATVKNSRIAKSAKDYYNSKLKHRIPPQTKEVANNITERLRKIPEKDLKRWKANGSLNELTKALGNVNTGDIEKLMKTGRNRLAQSKALKGFDQKKLQGLKGKASTVLRKGKKGASSVLKGGKWLGSTIKVIGKGKHVLAGPGGVVTFAAETAAVSLISSTVGELTERFLMNRQAVIIIPLQKEGVSFTAGVNGNKGSLIGEPSEGWKKFEKVVGVIASIFGHDFNPPSEKEIPGTFNLMAVSTANASDEQVEKVSTETLLKAIFNRKRIYEDNGKIEEYYKRDVEAAKKEIKGRVEFLISQSSEMNRPDYSEFEQKANEADNIFSRLLSLIKGGGEDDYMEVDGDIPLDGKAVNLSKYFSRLGPMIETEAKRQNMEKYAEILKAKCMQETGGNYERYPDVFQASESLGLPRNSIGLNKSIQQGVKYFGQVVKQAGGDIRLALQSYNFGGGFIGYVKSRGGSWTQELVNSFSDQKAKELGWRRYGDKNYVKNVLRYYRIPKHSGGADDAPATTGQSGAEKYRLSQSQANKQLIRPENRSDRSFNVTIVGGSSMMRPGSYQLLNQVAKEYRQKTGNKIAITSAYRAGDPRWHGTGYAVDVDTPNTMRRLSGGKLGFPPGRDKENARTLVDIAAKAGFNEIIFGDWFIIEEMKRKHKNTRFIYETTAHHNHLHLSHPKKK